MINELRRHIWGKKLIAKENKVRGGRLLGVFFTSDNSLVIFIVINHILISDLLYLFIYLIFAFIYIYNLYTFAMHCIALLLHMHFPMHCIAFSCICAFTCIACPCILLVSHFTYIKGFLSPLAAQAYKLQVVASR